MYLKYIDILFLFVILTFGSIFAQVKTDNFYNVDSNNIALQGYDIVEYFNSNSAKKGNKEFSSEYEGIKYLFSTEQNVNIFMDNPQKYIPAFGGWCPYGIGMTEKRHGYAPGKYQIDPNSFKIIDNKLHLFYNASDFDAKKSWETDEKFLLKSASETWDKWIKNGQAIKKSGIDEEDTIEDLTNKLYKYIEYNSSISPNWIEFENLFYKTAKLISLSGDEPQIWTPKEFSNYYQKIIDDGKIKEFSEKEIFGNTDLFGKIAHRFSTYETLSGRRGINSIQFIYVNNKWVISSIVWNDQNDRLTIPYKFLKH